MSEQQNEMRMIRGGSSKGKTISFTVTLEKSQAEKLNELFKEHHAEQRYRHRLSLVNLHRAMDGMKPLKSKLE